jgi:hypothetical protein
MMASIPIKNSNMTMCGLSGFMCHFEDTVLLWNGVRCRKDLYEQRNPQDFIFPYDDVQAPMAGTLSENNSNAVQLGGDMISESGVSLTEEDGDTIELEETL